MVERPLAPLCRPSAVAAFVSVLAIAPAARAQDSSAPEPASQTAGAETRPKSGPDTLMLGSGLVIFGASYVPAATVGLTSGRAADERMIVPVAGPWLAMFDRGGCGGTTGRSCDTETTYKVLIAVDGVFQAIGALDVAGSFFRHEPVTPRRRSASHKIFDPRVAFAPTTVGSGYGLGAVGAF